MTDSKEPCPLCKDPLTITNPIPMVYVVKCACSEGKSITPELAFATWAQEIVKLESHVRKLAGAIVGNKTP
jgi:hypothetical protein